MEQNNQSMMIEYANPTILWLNIASYLGNLSKLMNKKYTQKRRKSEEITWAELDEVNKNLHHQLDVIISGDKNVTDNTAPKYESIRRSNMGRTIRLNESELKRMIDESIRRVLNEGKDDFEAGKYQGKWSVFSKPSRTFSHIGIGKKKAIKKARELNDYCAQKDKEENDNKTSESFNRKIYRIVSECIRRNIR